MRHSERTNGTNEAPNLSRLSGDELRQAIVAMLVDAGLNTTQIRDNIKGEAKTIGEMVQAVKQRGVLQ